MVLNAWVQGSYRSLRSPVTFNSNALDDWESTQSVTKMWHASQKRTGLLDEWTVQMFFTLRSKQRGCFIHYELSRVWKCWYETFQYSMLKIAAVCPQCLVTRLAHSIRCISAVSHRCTAGRERLYIFIKSTREQHKGLCSLDTPHLFIIIPPAVTLPFILAYWFICCSSLKTTQHL